MALHVHWYLPTNGDSREIVGSGDRSQDQLADVAGRFRDADIEYLGLIAKTAERLGFEAVLTPTGTWCEDAWIVTAALSQLTERLKFLVAFRPGLVSPTLAAHQAATFQRVSRGRLLLNVVTGGDSVEQRRFGDHLDHDQRYERTEEFIAILRGVGDDVLGPDETFSFAGRHYDVVDARIALGGRPRPEVFFGGASPAAERVAARQADTYLAWGETPEQIAQRLERMRALADGEGRELTYGIRLHVISRDTSAAAWAEADRLLAGLSAERIAAARAQLAASESVGQQRMLALNGGGRLEVAPNLWAGYGLVRGGAGTALVGSHDEVADRIAEYHELGIDHFILSGQPHLEEAFWFGEGAAHVLRARGLLNPTAQEVTGA